jgi:hypothetical protein
MSVKAFRDCACGRPCWYRRTFNGWTENLWGNYTCRSDRKGADIRRQRRIRQRVEDNAFHLNASSSSPLMGRLAARIELPRLLEMFLG